MGRRHKGERGLFAVGKRAGAGAAGDGGRAGRVGRVGGRACWVVGWNSFDAPPAAAPVAAAGGWAGWACAAGEGEGLWSMSTGPEGAPSRARASPPWPAATVSRWPPKKEPCGGDDVVVTAQKGRRGSEGCSRIVGRGWRGNAPGMSRLAAETGAATLQSARVRKTHQGKMMAVGEWVKSRPKLQEGVIGPQRFPRAPSAQPPKFAALSCGATPRSECDRRSSCGSG